MDRSSLKSLSIRRLQFLSQNNNLNLTRASSVSVFASFSNTATKFHPSSSSFQRRLSSSISKSKTVAVAERGNGNSLSGPAAPLSQNKLLQVVLVSPQIPGNAGCIARTCAASAVALHLVGPLGFKVDDTKLKRAGLDYWPYVVVRVHRSWEAFQDYFKQQEGNKRLLAFTKRGTAIHSVKQRAKVALSFIFCSRTAIYIWCLI
ncbi:hypothetical protein REPUB_Repub12eG0217900 [Reevesia pubescens]